MPNTKTTPTWGIDWDDTTTCVWHVLHSVEDDREMSDEIAEYVEKHSADTYGLFDLEAGLKGKISTAQERLYDAACDRVSSALENVVDQWESVSLLLVGHRDGNCDCSTFDYEHAVEYWKDWLAEVAPADAQSWYLLAEDGAEEQRFDSDFSIQDFISEHVPDDAREIKASFDAEQRILTISSWRHKRLYCPTSEEVALVSGIGFEDDDGVFTFLGKKGDKRQVELIANLASIDDFESDIFSSYYNASHHVQQILAGMPEEAHDVLFELAGVWGGTEDELRVEAVARTLPPAAHVVFTSLAEVNDYPTDLRPYVAAALASAA